MCVEVQMWRGRAAGRAEGTEIETRQSHGSKECPWAKRNATDLGSNAVSKRAARINNAMDDTRATGMTP